MKKTPLGPGSNQRGLSWRSYGEVMRPAYEDLIADRCVEAAAQPRDGCAADMMSRPGRVALRPVCPRAEAHRPGCPNFRVGVGGAVLDPSTGSRIGKALISRGTPSGEQGSIRQAAPGRGWTLQVSRHETLEKAGNCVNYRPNGRANGRPRTRKSATCAQIAY